MSRKSLRWICLVFVGCTMAAATEGNEVSLLQAVQTQTIPAEVLSQYESDVVFGSRPTLAVLRQKDLIGLENRGAIDVDFVLLDFKPADISTIQRERLVKWVSQGHNRVLLLGPDLQAYGPLLGISVRRYELPAAGVGASAELRVVTTSAVAADAMRVATRSEAVGPGGWPGDCAAYWNAVDVGETKGVTAVAMYANHLAAAGLCEVESGKVYFFPRGPLTGGDADRFRLNFLHWAMGLPIPGEAPPAPAPTTRRTVRVEVIEADEVSDIVVLADGETLLGTVLDANFIVETPTCRTDFATGRVDRIDFRYTEGGNDVLTLVGGSRFTGKVLNDPVAVRTASGEVRKLPKATIREILFRVRRGAPACGDP